jgi:hypothetical protein
MRFLVPLIAGRLPLARPDAQVRRRGLIPQRERAPISRDYHHHNQDVGQ